MKEINKLRILFRNGESFNMNTLLGVFQNLSRENKRYKLNFITFFSKKNPIKMFKEWKQKDFSFDIRKFDDFYNVDLNRIIERADIEGGKREINGSFGLFQHKITTIWTAFTSDSQDFFINGLIRFIEAYKPDISKIYLSSEEIRKIFEKLEEKISCEIFVKKAVLYSHIEEGQITFEKKPFQSLFNKAENEDRYVDKIEYYIKKDNEQVYHGFISRRGVSYYYSGNINYFFNVFIPLIADRGKIKSEIFENRERKFGTLEMKPINIVYPKDVFKTNFDNIRLIKALIKVSRGAVTVYHKNPYIHVSFLDFVDGSNFDIFAAEPNKISLIPNFKCSIHSLMRVCEQISKDFNEGNLELFDKHDFTFNDFIGE